MSFDVFLSHNSKDKAAVRDLKQQLIGCSLTAWLDEDELQPGIPWQQLLEDGIHQSRSIAVLIGSDGLGPWEDEEMQAALRLAVADKRPVIPVLMPGAAAQPKLPMFLGNRTWVDLRNGFAKDGLSKLVWGITGKKPTEPIPETSASTEFSEAATRSRIEMAEATVGPRILARFQEEDGKPLKVNDGEKNCFGYWIDMWIEGAPPETSKVIFEVDDEERDEPSWTIKRSNSATKNFLTDDFTSYGNFEISAVGAATGHPKLWQTKSWLLDALKHFYGNNVPNNKAYRHAFDQLKSESNLPSSSAKDAMATSTPKKRTIPLWKKLTGGLAALVGVVGIVLNWPHLDEFVARFFPPPTPLACANVGVKLEKFSTWSHQYVVPNAVDLSITARAETGLYAPDLTVPQFQKINGVDLKVFVGGTQCREAENVTDQPVLHGGHIMAVETTCNLKSLPAGSFIVRVEPTTVGSCNPAGGHCDHKSLTVDIACSDSKPD
jgi:TIR domain